MKKIKIDVKNWWRDANGGILKRVQRQFFSNSDSENFELTSDNPDFTIVFGRTEWEVIKTPKDRTFYFSQEPLFSQNEPKDDIHNFCSKIFIADKSLYPDRSEYIEDLMPMFYAGRDESSSDPQWSWSREIENKSFDKDQALSIVCAKNYNSHIPSIKDKCSVIYTKRTQLAESLSDNKSVHIYGTFWENNGDNLRGETWNKHVALDSYMFSVGCENSIQKNYVSEKFWDIILTEGVPIYLGCNNIEDYIPSDSFINLAPGNINDMGEIIKDVIANYDNLYKKYRPKILELKSDFFRNPKFNLWEKIKLEINNQ